MMGQALTYIEIDADHCSRTYGVAPCIAALGVTGNKKCFNTARTCQDRTHYSNTPVTYRFAKDCDYLPRTIDVVAASVVSVSFTPGTISLGEDLGLRSSITVTFKDHRFGDGSPDFDKYLSGRTYDAYDQGSFWGKFRARNPYLRGRPLRWIMGFVGQSLASMETRNFIIESFSGPTPQGVFTVVAKDALKIADDDRAQAPALSLGSLLANITDTDNTLIVTPSGVGSTYASSGYIAVGGKEIMAFTRSGDTFTVTRAQFNTTAVAHTAEDRVQACLHFNGVDPAVILYTLLVTYAGVSSSYITLSDWTTESAAYLGNVNTTLITQPTGVNQLIKEIIQQTASAMWWDDLNKKIRWQVLRPISTSANVYDESNMLAGSLSVSEQPDTRISQCYVFYGQRNPLGLLDDEANYRSAILKLAAQEQSDYGSPAIKKIFSRWIPQFGSTLAQRIANIHIARYKNPPRAVSFEVFRRQSGATPTLGAGYNVRGHSLQLDDGSEETVPVQVTRLKPSNEKIMVEAQEALFANDGVIDTTNRAITINSNTNNFNLRTVHDTLFPVITSGTGLTLTCYINAGVTVGSTSTSTPAFDVGSWVSGLVIEIVNRGRIQGHGGDGASTLGVGGNGGDAFYTRFPVTLNNTAGQILGGGGGGAASANAGGGGGQGAVPGTGGYAASGYSGTNGSTTAAGLGGDYPFLGTTSDGGNGGSSGNAGDYNGSGAGTPGAAGKAIDGWSHVTMAGTGIILGATVN